MSDNQAEQKNVYKKYSIRTEHALCVTGSINKCDSCNGHYTCSCKYNNYYNDVKKSSVWIEGKLWELTYDSYGRDLELGMSNNHSSSDSNTAAEIVLWYWNDKKEIVILHQEVHDDFSYHGEETKNLLSINNKFNVVIRLLDKRQENDNKNLLESYYEDFGETGISMVTLRICGTDGETEASFTVPKRYLMNKSSVFNRMFTAEMTEKATGKVKIEDTNAEKFGDFLKAISPKQEHPNPSNVRALLKLADRYECQLLRDRCEAHLMNCIEIPLVERVKCANFYRLNGLKENLLEHFEGTGIEELCRDAKPHRELLPEITSWFNE